jgi:Emfourin
MGGVAAGCLAMMVSISTSGGIGGFGLAKSTEISVDSLPEPLREETCARLDATALGRIKSAPPRGAADYVIYHIVIVDDGGQPRTFDLPETALSPETLDLIDALLAR